MRDDLAEIFFHSFQQKAPCEKFWHGQYVCSWILSIQHFLCWPWCCPPFKIPWRMILERLSWCVTCLSHASFGLWTVARRCSCGPTMKLILLCTQLWQETCRTWTCLQSWWCCTTRSCLVWPLLPLLRQSRFRLQQSKCCLCTGLLPSTWNWSPPLTSGCSC